MTKRKVLRISAVLFAVIFAGAVFATINGGDSALLVEAAAAEEYEMSDEYKASSFYANLNAVERTGDQAKDVLAIAMSQVGYHEGDSEEDLGGKNRSGSRDFVEYNVLNGKLDNGQGNGMSYGYYWCASFATWCLRLAGVERDAMAGGGVNCSTWFNNCKKEGIYKSKSGYIPAAGDIVFFNDPAENRTSTHVGIVRYSDGKKIYTVEGNVTIGDEYSSNGEYVAFKEHDISSGFIVGYATPKYNESNTFRRVDYSGSFLSNGSYIATEQLDVLAKPEEGESIGKVEPFTVFSVKSMDNGYLEILFAENNSVGYVRMSDEILQITTTEDIFIITYLNDDGSQMYMPQYRRAFDQKYVISNVPKRDDGGFVGWNFLLSDGTLFDPEDKLPNYSADMTLQAVWDENYYVVSFKNTDGTLLDQVHGYYGDKFNIPVTPEAPDGYVFGGWGESVDGVIRGNASYTVQFVPEDELADVGAQQDSEGCSSSLGGAAIVFSTIAVAACVFIGKKKK